MRGNSTQRAQMAATGMTAHTLEPINRRHNMKLRLAAVGLLTMLAVAGCGKKEEQAADQNATATAPAASNTTATAPAPAATDTNTQQAAATPAASGDKIGNCDLTGKKGETPLTPAVAGQLTVETNLPGPGWY